MLNDSLKNTLNKNLLNTVLWKCKTIQMPNVPRSNPSRPKNLQESNVIGFDYGEKRIGIAIGLTSIGTANPLTTLSVPSTGIPWDKIDSLIQQWQPNMLIVGRVEHQTQNDNRIQKLINSFCENLKSRYQLPVETIDESYSSATAYEILKNMRSEGKRKKINKEDIDKASAAIILHSWFAVAKESNS